MENLALSEEGCVKKKRKRSRVIPRKVRVGLKRRGELNKKKRLKISLVGINRKEGGLTFAQIEKAQKCSVQRSDQIRDSCVVNATVDSEGAKDRMARLSA